MVNGPRAGLAVLGTLDAARHAYQRAARMTTNLPEQRYLTLRAARLS
jgi:hypothetical protein